MDKPQVWVALRDQEHVPALVRLACEMARGMSAELTALHVVEVGPSLPLDAESELLDQRGKELLEQARQAAAEYSVALETLLVRARKAGPAIVDEARRHRAHLLIMGYHHKSGAAQILFGSNLGYVFRHAPCRVIVESQPVEAAGE
jgi:nucleotide-binding universal stress UspA family protein